MNIFFNYYSQFYFFKFIYYFFLISLTNLKTRFNGVKLLFVLFARKLRLKQLFGVLERSLDLGRHLGELPPVGERVLDIGEALGQLRLSRALPLLQPVEGVPVLVYGVLLFDLFLMQFLIFFLH
jgi:hypothetical protein